MTFRRLLITKAAACLVFGVFLLAAPATLFAVLGAHLNDAGMFAAREYGSALIGACLLTWRARDVRAADARGAILLYLLVYDAFAMVVTIQATLSGVFDAPGWLIVAVYAFFAVASAGVMVRQTPYRRDIAGDRT